MTRYRNRTKLVTTYVPIALIWGGRFSSMVILSVPIEALHLVQNQYTLLSYQGIGFHYLNQTIALEAYDTGELARTTNQDSKQMIAYLLPITCRTSAQLLARKLGIQLCKELTHILVIFPPVKLLGRGRCHINLYGFSGANHVDRDKIAESEYGGWCASLNQTLLFVGAGDLPLHVHQGAQSNRIDLVIRLAVKPLFIWNYFFNCVNGRAPAYKDRYRKDKTLHITPPDFYGFYQVSIGQQEGIEEQKALPRGGDRQFWRRGVRHAAQPDFLMGYQSTFIWSNNHAKTTT